MRLGRSNRNGEGKSGNGFPLWLENGCIHSRRGQGENTSFVYTWGKEYKRRTCRFSSSLGEDGIGKSVSFSSGRFRSFGLEQRLFSLAGAAAYTGRRRICRACLRDRPVSYKGISSLCVSALSGLREERKPRCGGIFPWWSWGSLSVFGNGGVCRSGQLFRFPVVSGLVQVYGKSFFAERAGVCISFPGQGREKDPFPSDGPQSRVHGKNQRSAFPTDGDGFASRFSME